MLDSLIVSLFVCLSGGFVSETAKLMTCAK
jgi:hypothetical protein